MRYLRPGGVGVRILERSRPTQTNVDIKQGSLDPCSGVTDNKITPRLAQKGNVSNDTFPSDGKITRKRVAELANV